MDDPLNSLYERLGDAVAPADRPFVTLTFAQSVDGSIAAAPGERTNLSGEASLTMTHSLRTRHDAILVGIGTVLADDPQLTAREARGPSPQPIVVDSWLRTPPGSKLLAGPLKPWIACAPEPDSARRRQLEALGAELLPTPQIRPEGLNLEALLQELRARGVDRLMVEGGARIIRSFLQKDLIDLIVITIVARLMDGLRPYDGAPEPATFPELLEPRWSRAGEDAVLWARAGRAAG